MGSNIALTLSDWATKLYNNFKFPGFSEMLWDNSTSRHTIKQNVSRFLQVPELIDAFWSSINSFPFFLLYESSFIHSIFSSACVADMVNISTIMTSAITGTRTFILFAGADVRETRNFGSSSVFSTVASFGFHCLFHRIIRSWKFWIKQMHVNTSVAYLKKNGFKGQLTLNLRKHWRVAEH